MRQTKKARRTERAFAREFAALPDSDVCALYAAADDPETGAALRRRITENVTRKIEEKGSEPVKMKKRIGKKAAAALIAAAILMLAAVGAAAYGWLRLPTERLKEELDFDVTNLARVVDLEHAEEGDVLIQNKRVQVDGYTVTFEAIVKANAEREILVGDGLDDADLSRAHDNGTFAVLTVTRDDGGAVWYGEDEKSLTGASIGASPLIHGVRPNMNTYCSVVLNHICEDNVLYLFVDITDELIWADHPMSLAVYGNFVFPSDWFELDENGAPRFTENAPALRAMFDLPLDPALADPAQQALYMRQRPFDWAE